MNWVPCARLTKFMMPNTSVRPAAIRNNSTPSCAPLSSCSRKSAMTARAAPALELAVLGVGVRLRLHDGCAGARDQRPVIALHDLAEIIVLDRIAVLVELELAAHRREIGLAQRG